MMPGNPFKLCNKCPTKSRHFDTDGYWCCKHPEAVKQLSEHNRSVNEPGDPVPVACLDKCPCGHWKRTIEGGKIPKTQTELIVDAEWMA
jgi:hypothetical protein